MVMKLSCQLYAAVALLPEEDVGTHWIGVWVGPRTSTGSTLPFYQINSIKLLIDILCYKESAQYIFLFPMGSAFEGTENLLSL
jgi:hypothetical protein